jgi:starvation-inducible DNA-binding protein
MSINLKMDTQIGIKPENRESVAHLLNTVLSNEFILYTKTRRAHWNIEGIDFHNMHTIFSSQYEQLDQMMDDVAERIRTIGHYAPATLKDFLALTQLSEKMHEKNEGIGFIKELLSDHENIIIHLRGKLTRRPPQVRVHSFFRFLRHLPNEFYWLRALT